MNVIAMMFNAYSLAMSEMKRSFRKGMGRPSAGVAFRRNKTTVAAARGLLMAYAMAHRARRDIAYFSGPRM